MPTRRRTFCKFRNCSGKVHAKSYCKQHFKQLEKNNYDETLLTPLQQLDTTTCTYSKCDKHVDANGYCEAHLNQYKKYNGDVSKMTPLRNNKKAEYYLTIIRIYEGGISREELREIIFKYLNIVFVGYLYKDEDGKTYLPIFFKDKSYKIQDLGEHLINIRLERHLSDGEEVIYADEDFSNYSFDNLQLWRDGKRVL